MLNKSVRGLLSVVVIIVVMLSSQTVQAAKFKPIRLIEKINPEDITVEISAVRNTEYDVQMDQAKWIVEIGGATIISDFNAQTELRQMVASTIFALDNHNQYDDGTSWNQVTYPDWCYVYEKNGTLIVEMTEATTYDYHILADEVLNMKLIDEMFVETLSDSRSIQLRIVDVEGDGSEIAPYIIDEVEDFDVVRNAHYGNWYVITEDLDFSGVAFEPIEYFEGGLTTYGNIISNLHLNGNSMFTYAKDAHFWGLTLEKVSGTGAIIAKETKDVVFEYCNMTHVTIDSGNYAPYTGAFVDNARGRTSFRICNINDAVINGHSNVGAYVGTGSEVSIDTVFVTKIEIQATGNNVGCLVGSAAILNTNASVKNSTIESNGSRVGGVAGSVYEGDINSAVVEEVTIKGYYYVGGLLGKLYRGNIESSDVDAAIQGYSNVGGILGSTSYYSEPINIDSNEVRGEMVGMKNVGGILGYVYRGDMENPTNVSNSRCDLTVMVGYEKEYFDSFHRIVGASDGWLNLSDNYASGAVELRVLGSDENYAEHYFNSDISGMDGRTDR